MTFHSRTSLGESSTPSVWTATGWRSRRCSASCCRTRTRRSIRCRAPAAATAGSPELDRLSNILRAFNEHFGDIRWEDADRVRQLIIETIPERVREDTAFRNAHRNSDRQNARIEHDKALVRVMTAVMRDDTELFKQFMDNDSFKCWMTDTVFSLAYEPAATP